MNAYDTGGRDALRAFAETLEAWPELNCAEIIVLARATADVIEAGGK